MTLTELTPLELNNFRFSGNHTPLTPGQIEQMRRTSKQNATTDAAQETSV